MTHRKNWNDQCWDFERFGSCPRGDRCRWAHGQQQLLLTSSPVPGPTRSVAETADDTGLHTDMIFVGTCGFMGLATAEYAQRFRCVELNFTFHDGQHGRDINVRNYAHKAKELKALGLSAVVKVSGMATHEMHLCGSQQWWPWLWDRYKVFLDAGVLAALLWQMPPSWAYSDAALQSLECLVNQFQTVGARHVFEFRHPSWYERSQVYDICRKHSVCMAWVHFANRTGWAGQMPSGWSPHDRVRTSDFVYLRLFGPEGRNLGKYSEDFLREEIVHHLPSGLCSFIMFAQSDVPMHARENALAIQELACSTSKTDGIVSNLNIQRPSSDLPAVGTDVSGRVVGVGRSYFYIDIGNGIKVKLGSNHVKAHNLRLERGSMIGGLRVEGISEQGCVYVTGHTLVLCTSSG